MVSQPSILVGLANIMSWGAVWSTSEILIVLAGTMEDLVLALPELAAVICLVSRILHVGETSLMACLCHHLVLS
jgi:hypothetical protein